jgi:hypothetical protein
MRQAKEAQNPVVDRLGPGEELATVDDVDPLPSEQTGQPGEVL